MRLSSVRTPWGHSWSSGPLRVDSERKLERERERERSLFSSESKVVCKSQTACSSLDPFKGNVEMFNFQCVSTTEGIQITWYMVCCDFGVQRTARRTNLLFAYLERNSHRCAATLSYCILGVPRALCII